MKFCKTCLFKEINPIPISFNKNGICTGCLYAQKKLQVDWGLREKKFLELVANYKDKQEYDCIIPVSGGKDSYFAAHLAKKYNLKALMVTYYSDRYLEEGKYNLFRMKEIFKFDHTIYTPPKEILIKMHRIGLKKMGDQNMHNHMGIDTYPNIIAVEKKIPLILWGDQGFTEQGGMHSINDFVEYTTKYRLEHAQHGFDWYDFIDIKDEYLEKKDLSPYIYPDEKKIKDIGVRGIYLSNYFFYDGNHNYKISKEHYNWKEISLPFERTYRKFSNIDDMHENGVHDYLKFIKFGFGRGTDHANYDVRLNLISKEEGIRLVLKYDHITPEKDLKSWCEYVNMSKDEFYFHADKFRDPRVWSKKNGYWYKTDIDNKERKYHKIRN
jgi:N-acetyl sugar amidotransferase|tara:strand:+ start:2229 stop:3374 length:1146 start_codon:yes stop_codon:yes gene_type:complete